MSDFERISGGFRISATVTKITNKATKGGVLQISIETPLSGNVAAAFIEHINNAGMVSFEYNDPQKKLDFNAYPGGGTATHQAGVIESVEYEDEIAVGPGNAVDFPEYGEFEEEVKEKEETFSPTQLDSDDAVNPLYGGEQGEDDDLTVEEIQNDPEILPEDEYEDGEAVPDQEADIDDTPDTEWDDVKVNTGNEL